jgi:hypothetical protein
MGYYSSHLLAYNYYILILNDFRLIKSVLRPTRQQLLVIFELCLKSLLLFDIRFDLNTHYRFKIAIPRF